MPVLIPIPSLDEIAADGRRLEGLDACALAALALRANAVASAVTVHLALAMANGGLHDAPEVQDDRMLTPSEAAPLLRKQPRWIYRHASTLPFVKRVSPRSLLCSEVGIRRWLERRKV